MAKYFEEEKSLSLFSCGNIETALELMSNRYIGANPRYDYIPRPFFTGEIKRNKDYRYEADFNKIFPDAPFFSYVYCWGKYYSEFSGELKFLLIPKGPVKLWVNGEVLYGTTAESERYDNDPISINLPLEKGWNDLVLRFTKTKTGFGAEFGTWLGKLCYYFFRGLTGNGLAEGGTQTEHSFLIEGFDITAPMLKPLENPLPENLSPLCLPLPAWTSKELSLGVFERIFPNAGVKSQVMALSEVFLPVSGTCVLSGFYKGDCSLYAGKTLVKQFKGAGKFEFEHKLEAGGTLLTVITIKPELKEQDADKGAEWDFSLLIKLCEKHIPADSIKLLNPFFKHEKLPWIYAGPFTQTPSEKLAGNNAPGFDRELLVGEGGERTFWRLDMPGAWVRLYNDNPLYGRWNYPLGVTLYGLIETARYFNTFNSTKALGEAIAFYVQAHAAKSVHTLEYALFDKEHFGGATAVHHLLTSIDSLDDCGSFGSLILELSKDLDIGNFALPADYTAEHILKKQDRLKEGCFWRRDMMHHFHNQTLWADDLYMSVPFLCRYSAYKNDPAILDIAALQFEGFKKYLFMEQKKLMAHVFDFKRNMNTGIPWGRGNGWTIFSLTEILMVLPKDHPKTSFLIDFFISLAAGFLACQDENGMWHQVLDMPSSYIESSCTAMFICAFSRGIRFGWFDKGSAPIDTKPYQIAAEKAWQALEKYSIDKEGNLHGVCRGSEFAFNPQYYAEHLLPRLNDTHGIGIVLLAGVELLKLRSFKAAQ